MALCCQRSALPSPSSIILGSRAAITAQTAGQSQPGSSIGDGERGREGEREAEGREEMENHSVSVAASLESDLIDSFCTLWVQKHWYETRLDHEVRV